MCLCSLIRGSRKTIASQRYSVSNGPALILRTIAMTERGKNTFSGGHVAILATVVIWSTPSLFQFYLIRYYEPWSQNFYRYLVAFVAVLPFVIWRFRKSGTRLTMPMFLA